MNFFEIPTDNLYKFMAITGIVLLIAAYIPFYHIHKIQVDLARLKGEVELTKEEADWMRKESKIFEQKVETLIEQVVELTGMSTSEITSALNAGHSLSDIGEAKHTNLEKHQMKWEELEAKKPEQRKLLQELKIKLTKVKTDLAVQDYHLKWLIREKRLAITSSLVGFFLALFGFQRWYTKLQAPQDQIIKQKAKDEL